MNKIITWLDLEGRYRVTSPAYNDPTSPVDETEDECIERVWAKLVAVGGYGIPLNHPRYLVEDADQRARLVKCCGTYFRYPPSRSDDRDAAGKVRPEVIAKYAWEMDVDGRPKVNMPKARAIQMDYIRVMRDAELVKFDVPFMRAVEAGDVVEQTRIATLRQTLRDIPQAFSLSSYTTPETLKAAWPTELPQRIEA